MSRNDEDRLLAAFGEMINAFGGGGDTGNLFPKSDVEDLANGAKWIPGEVTLARRAGQKVTFNQEGSKENWYWELENGKQIKHGNN